MHHKSGLADRNPDSLGIHEQILRCAMLCFVELGYQGTSVRQIANRVGLSVPGLYHYFPSKLAILEELIDHTMDDLICLTERSLDDAGKGAIDQFVAVVRAHVQFLCDRPEESFIGNTELRSLSEDGARRTVEKRDRQQRILDDVLQAGVDAEVFHVRTPREASRAIVTMCTAVATWYHRDGEMSAAQIVDVYQDLALTTVGCASRHTSDQD